MGSVASECLEKFGNVASANPANLEMSTSAKLENLDMSPQKFEGFTSAYPENLRMSPPGMGGVAATCPNFRILSQAFYFFSLTSQIKSFPATPQVGLATLAVPRSQSLSPPGPNTGPKTPQKTRRATDAQKFQNAFPNLSHVR